MDIEFDDNDFSDSDVEEKSTLNTAQQIDYDSSVEGESEAASSVKKAPREPAVASDNPPGIEKNNVLCIDKKILTNYRTIGFVHSKNRKRKDVVLLMVAPEGNYFATGRKSPKSLPPSKDDPVAPRVYFILLEAMTVELCQFDVSFTISVESYSCSCAPDHRECTRSKKKMAFVSEGKPENAPRCLLYKMIPSSPPSVRRWYPQDYDTTINHHKLPSSFRFVFKGKGPSVGNVEEDDDLFLSSNGSKVCLDEEDDDVSNSNRNFVSSKSQQNSERLWTRIRDYPYVSAHEVVHRLDTSILYENVLGRTQRFQFRKERKSHDRNFSNDQSFFMFPMLEPFFGFHGENVSIPVVKMSVARRVARLLDMAYEYDPLWKAAKKVPKSRVAIDDDCESGIAAKNSKPVLRRVPIAFVMAFAFWGGHEDFSHFPSDELPPLDWPCGKSRPSYQLGLACTKIESEAITKGLSNAVVNPRQIGIARNPTAVSEFLLKFCRRHNQRLPYVYAGRLDSDAASDRRRVIRFCRHYGFSIDVATIPFYANKHKIARKDMPDLTRFLRLIDLFMELSQHSVSSASFCYDRLSDVDARGGSCEIPAVAPRRVALQVANACTITVLPGTDPRIHGVCKTYGIILRYLKAYVLIRDMSNPEAAASVKKWPHELQFERIKTKRTVFSGHEALMEMFARHFHWNSENCREYESVLVRTGVFLDAISYCNLRKFEANPVTIGTKQFRDAFESLGVKEIPSSFFGPERSSTFETALKACIPPEIGTNGVHFEWTGSARIEEATAPGSSLNARFFYLYDRDTWRALDTISTKMPKVLNEFNIRLSGEMLSTEVPDQKNEIKETMKLINKLASIDQAGSLMVIVPQVLGSPHVEHLRSMVKQVYGNIDKNDEFDLFFSESKFVVQSHEIKDSLASSPKMKGCDIVLASSHLLGVREFIDIITRIVRETTASRITIPGETPEKQMTIYLDGFIYGMSPSKKSALSALFLSSLELDTSIPLEPDGSIILDALCSCSVFWTGSDCATLGSSPKRRKTEEKSELPIYLKKNSTVSSFKAALRMGNTLIIPTGDSYVSDDILQCIGSDYNRVYIDAFVKVSRYGRPTLPYGSGELFKTKQANEKFWTGASFIRSVNDFPGQDAVNYDPRTNIVVTINRLALEYSCTNRRQLLWLLSRARIIILTDVKKKQKRFDAVQPPSPTSDTVKPYVAASEIKRVFGTTTRILENDTLGSVERYIRDLFGAL